MSQSFQCLSCISCYVKNFCHVLSGSHLFGDYFLFLRRTLYNTWKSYYRQFQVLIMIFNKKTLVNISSISNLKNPPWNLLSFTSRFVVNECLKSSVRGVVLVFLWFQIIGKTIKKTFFFTVTHICSICQVSMSQFGKVLILLKI